MKTFTITVEQQLIHYTAGAFSMRVAALEAALANERSKHIQTQEALEGAKAELVVLKEKVC